ncbi:MAG: flagellar hook-basal body complex protein FliE [Clostridia bacterium]|nr:flagellar hook-basal body complex protein FliE [Clostridia bacterium]
MEVAAVTGPVAPSGGIPLWEPGSRIAGPGSAQGGDASPKPAAGEGPGFLAELQKALWQVNAFQLEAQAAGQALASGSVDDVAKAMIAAQKASLALELTVEVRNRAIEAYQEVMRMQI